MTRHKPRLRRDGPCTTSEADETTRAARRSLEELAAQQGVAPVTDLDELGKLWPADDDPDRFLAFVFSERRARRSRGEQE